MNSIAERLKATREERGLSQPLLAKAAKVTPGTIGNVESGQRKKPRELIAIAEALGVTPKWLETGEGRKDAESTALAPHESPRPGHSNDLVITQYETGGAMGHGYVLENTPPGIIRSWHVNREWLQTNVPMHSGFDNLAIVTGFGPSMRGLYNPGDPLLVDRGVKIVDHDGVYFFRIGDEGFIKIIQRVPEFDKAGIRLRIISKNEDYPPYDISPKNPDFEVLGKVLTIWKSEQH